MHLNGLSAADMCKQFGISISTFNKIISEPTECVQEPSVCYIYRQYTEHPELLDIDNIDIYQFFLDVGGTDTLSGTDFSLILGRELSAYVRWSQGSAPSQSVKKLIQNAMKLNGNDKLAAFESIKALCEKEGTLRGINVLEEKRWTNSKRKTSKSPIKDGKN